MKRITAACLAMLVALILWASPVLASEFVVELLRLDVPAAQRQIWLEAEASTWQPWLERQDGFRSRALLGSQAGARPAVDPLGQPHSMESD